MLNTPSISQKRIENKFYSMNKERMNPHRQKILRESARFINTNTTSETKQYSNNKKYPKKKSLDVNIVIVLETLILNVLTNKEKTPFKA